jgi:hypothetical protein
VEGKVGDAPGRLVLRLAVVRPVIAGASLLNHQFTPVAKDKALSHHIYVYMN